MHWCTELIARTGPDQSGPVTVTSIKTAGVSPGFNIEDAKGQRYANGYEVESSLPGGATVALSGTSMAAPQATNLAAKLWAARPDLTVAEVRRVILDGADEKTIGEGRVIKLMNPRRSFEIVEAGR